MENSRAIFFILNRISLSFNGLDRFIQIGSPRYLYDRYREKQSAKRLYLLVKTRLFYILESSAMSFSSNKSHFINIRAYFPCNPHPSRLNRAIFTLVESAYNEHPPPITGPAEGAPYQIQCSRVSDYNSRSHHKVGVGLEVGAGETPCPLTNS